MNKKPQTYGTMASTSDVNITGNIPAEVNTLSDNIVTNIYTVNQSWKTLESCHKSIGTNKDNQGLRDKIHVTQLSTNQIISATTKNIHRLTMIVRRGEKSQKLQVEKLTDNFKEAIGRYSSLQKEVADKMKANLLVIVNQEQENNLLVNFENDSNLQKQAQLAREMAFEQDMLVERESRVIQIEADILDVNQIMRELSALVNQQGEVIDTIENSIDHATGHVEEGASELIKAASYQNKFRRKIFILLIIAFIIAAILITILVIELK